MDANTSHPPDSTECLLLQSLAPAFSEGAITGVPQILHLGEKSRSDDCALLKPLLGDYNCNPPNGISASRMSTASPSSGGDIGTAHGILLPVKRSQVVCDVPRVHNTQPLRAPEAAEHSSFTGAVLTVPSIANQYQAYLGWGTDRQTSTLDPFVIRAGDVHHNKGDSCKLAPSGVFASPILIERFCLLDDSPVSSPVHHALAAMVGDEYHVHDCVDKIQLIYTFNTSIHSDEYGRNEIKFLPQADHSVLSSHHQHETCHSRCNYNDGNITNGFAHLTQFNSSTSTTSNRTTRNNSSAQNKRAKTNNKSHSSRKKRPGCHDIYVDASGFGIGVVIDGEWLAWKFNRSHSSIPRTRTGDIDISWSELIAVELGVLTAVSAGYTNCNVRIWSDNAAVVSAVRTRSWGDKKRLNKVLRRIKKIFENNSINLQAVWISTHSNPADGPSRGNYPPYEDMFAQPPAVPAALGGLIKRVRLRA